MRLSKKVKDFCQKELVITLKHHARIGRAYNRGLKISKYKMKNIQSILLKSKRIIYQICGFQALILDGTFKRNNSVSRYYSVFVAMLFVLAEVVNMVYTRLRQDPKHSKTHQVTAIAFIFISASCVVLSIISESFIMIKEKIQMYNKFLDIHQMLSSKPFIESELIVLIKNNFYVFVILNTVQVTFITLVWEEVLYGVYFSIKTVVMSMTVLEIVMEINTCRYYVSKLNESLVSRYDTKIKQDEIDFGKTSLYARNDENNEKVRQIERNKKSEIDYTNIYDMLSDNIKLISQRFIYTVHIKRHIF